MNARLKFVLVTLASTLAWCATMSMGLWQVSRAHEKQALQVALSAQSALAPLDGSALRAASQHPMAVLHHKARVRGTWISGTTLFLDNRPMRGRVGFLVLGALALDGGGVVLVQRGWIPRDFEDRTRLPFVDTPAAAVVIDGRMALPPSALFQLGASAGGAIRQNLDLVQFRKESGLPLMDITLQQTDAPSEGLLREWPPINMGVEKNWGYAFQWFGMSAVIVVMYVWFQIVRRVSPRSKNPSHHV